MIRFSTDLRFGLRALAGNPTFVVVAVLLLGIGIGTSAMTFTVVNDALRKPLGAIDGEGLVEIWEQHRTSPEQWWPVSHGRFLDWRAATSERAELGAFREESVIVGPRGVGARVEGTSATGNLFSLLGAAPILGRGLQPVDETPGAEPVVVVVESYWRAQLGGDPGVVGRSIEIDGTRHTVIGVVPALLDVGVPPTIRRARLWLPLRSASQPPSRTDRSLQVVARLAGGVSLESFAAQLDSVSRDLAAVYPEDVDWSPTLVPMGFSSIASMRPALWLSMGAAWLVLLVATANLANLTLAYALRRRHEFGIRAAIGASPWRLAGQLLCEGLGVAALGALLGVFLARLGLDLLAREYEAQTLAPAVLPMDAVSLAFVVALAFVVTALFAVLPALEVARVATRVQVAESGAGTTATRGRTRLRRGLVAAQVAASLVLLVGAALVSKSFMNLLAIDAGVEIERVTSIRVESAGPIDDGDVERFANGVVGALAALPGVETAASANHLLPLRGGGLSSTLSFPGDEDIPRAARTARYVGVTPGFFETLGIPLLAGRSFDASGEGNRAAVISEELARELWPGEDPVGRRFLLDAEAERGWVTVLGIAGDVLTWDSSGDRPLPLAYLDVDSFSSRPVFFFIRHRADAPAIGADTISRAIDALGLPVTRIVVTPMEQVARDPFWRQRLFSLWFTIFGVAAVVLTVAGIYAVLAALVSQRVQEMGIRMALGAGPREVLFLVMREAGAFVGVGIAVGVCVAYLFARTLGSLLYGVEAFDGPVFLASAALLVAAAMAASLAPSVRAARVDPKVLLRR